MASNFTVLGSVIFHSQVPPNRFVVFKDGTRTRTTSNAAVCVTTLCVLFCVYGVDGWLKKSGETIVETAFSSQDSQFNR